MKTEHIKENHFIVTDYSGRPHDVFTKKGGTEQDAIDCYLEACQGKTGKGFNSLLGLGIDQEQLIDLGIMDLCPKTNTIKFIDGREITPCCDPATVCPEKNGIENICSIVHTPEIKTEYKKSLPPVQKTESVTKEVERIEMIDGQPTLIKERQEIKEPVFDHIQVVDQSGNPVFKTIPAVFDYEGNEVEPEKQEPVMHKVPVYETAP